MYKFFTLILLLLSITLCSQNIILDKDGYDSKGNPVENIFPPELRKEVEEFVHIYTKIESQILGTENLEDKDLHVIYDRRYVNSGIYLKDGIHMNFDQGFSANRGLFTHESFHGRRIRFTDNKDGSYNDSLTVFEEPFAQAFRYIVLEEYYKEKVFPGLRSYIDFMDDLAYTTPGSFFTSRGGLGMDIQRYDITSEYIRQLYAVDSTLFRRVQREFLRIKPVYDNQTATEKINILFDIIDGTTRDENYRIEGKSFSDYLKSKGPFFQPRLFKGRKIFGKQQYHQSNGVKGGTALSIGISFYETHVSYFENGGEWISDWSRWNKETNSWEFPQNKSYNDLPALNDYEGRIMVVRDNKVFYDNSFAQTPSPYGFSMTEFLFTFEGETTWTDWAKNLGHITIQLPEGHYNVVVAFGGTTFWLKDIIITRHNSGIIATTNQPFVLHDGVKYPALNGLVHIPFFNPNRVFVFPSQKPIKKVLFYNKVHYIKL